MLNSIEAERARYHLSKEELAKKLNISVRKGSRGEDVIYLQKQLTVLGYSVGAIDGIFGYKTLDAVKAFQAENRLVVDGIVGQRTWKEMSSV